MLAIAMTLMLGSPVLLGDANCDGAVNFADINPFVMAVSGGAIEWTYATGCPVQEFLCINDINRDGLVDFADINAFVDLLTSGAQRTVDCEAYTLRLGAPVTGE